AGAGGLNDGEVTITVPAGWQTPQTSNPFGGAAWATTACGSVSVTGSTIHVTGLTLNAGDTCGPITYGNKFFGGAGSSAPASSGTSTFTTQEKSTSGGTLTNIATSPQ